MLAGMELVPEEVRVAGCLIEKQLVTPQQYPLTLNALVAGCNQSSSRWPITRYGERTVESALDALKEKRLVRFVHPSHGRSVTRYRQVLDETLGLEPAQLALLGILMLRGAQTPGELRARTERMVELDGVEATEAALKVLAARDEPLVVRLHREPGQREVRYAHLLAGAESALQSAEYEPGPGGVSPPVTGDERSDDGAEAPPEVPIADALMALRADLSALGRALDHILARLSR